LEGLKVLHSNNIVHRDIRPANSFVSFLEKKQVFENPQVTIIDYGLAKVPQLAEIDKIKPFSFYFSPPEQVLKLDGLVDERSDIYSLGISMWTILTGKVPFYHKIPEVIANLQIAYPLPRHPKIPENLWEIIQKATVKPVFNKSFNKYAKKELITMLQEAKNLRYMSAQEMIVDLRKII
jgi:serine/threonine-protein kinase